VLFDDRVDDPDQDVFYLFGRGVIPMRPRVITSARKAAIARIIGKRVP